jgi:biotin-(acetyl-CoA carboxylase) ligase
MRANDGNIVKLECHDTLPSTVSLARDYAKLGYPDRYVVFSEKRKKYGSGKIGTVERGVFMSCILRPSLFASQSALLGPLCAVAVATALEEHTTKRLGIGWISKIYCDGRIIGDVSVEGKLDSFTSYEYIILTFSIVLDEKTFPPRLTDIVRQVFESESVSIPLVVAKHILNNFFTLYPELKTPAKFMDTYSQKFLLRGRKVRCLLEGKRQRCKILQVSHTDCSLLVETRNKTTVKISTPKNVALPRRLPRNI